MTAIWHPLVPVYSCRLNNLFYSFISIRFFTLRRATERLHNLSAFKFLLMPTRVNPVQLLVLLCFPLLFTSCLKDECRNKFTIYQPVYKSLSSVRKEMGFTQARKMERPGKIYQYGAYLLVNELWKGIHVFDNTNPASPRKLGFINILGNVDIAIRKDRKSVV